MYAEASVLWIPTEAFYLFKGISTHNGRLLRGTLRPRSNTIVSGSQLFFSGRTTAGLENLFHFRTFNKLLVLH